MVHYYVGEENLENDQPVQEQTQYKIPQERGNLAGTQLPFDK